MDYVFWQTVAPSGYCMCTTLQGFDDEHLIAYGQSVADRFPDNTHYEMSRQRRATKLADAVDNYDSYILASPRLRAFLETRIEEPVEFLATTILDRDGEVASAEYSIVNVLEFHDAIDLELSDVKWNNIDPDKINRFRKLVLATDRIPPESKVLRLTHFPNRLLLRRDFAEAVEAEGFTGVRFVETEGFSR